jgi:RNA polymerase sigma-54 factor
MDHLLFQLHLSTSDPDLLTLGTMVIGYLDESGYLKEPLEAVAAAAGVELSPLEEALRLVQGFEPTGVGARDLRECLLLQLETRPDQHPLAKELIAAHLPELEGRQWEKLAGSWGSQSGTFRRRWGTSPALSRSPAVPSGPRIRATSRRTYTSSRWTTASWWC